MRIEDKYIRGKIFKGYKYSVFDNINNRLLNKQITIKSPTPPQKAYTKKLLSQMRLKPDLSMYSLKYIGKEYEVYNISLQGVKRRKEIEYIVEK